MKSKIQLLSSTNRQRRIVAYLDSIQARLASLQELQSATGEELSALLPSVLDRLLLEFVHTELDLYKKLTDSKVNDMLKRQWFEVLSNEMGG